MLWWVYVSGSRTAQDVAMITDYIDWFKKKQIECKNRKFTAEFDQAMVEYDQHAVPHCHIPVQYNQDDAP